MKEFTLAPLQKSLAALQAALAAGYTEHTRDSAIKRFELTYELAWKTLRRFLAEFGGVETGATVRDIYRAAGEAGLLQNGGVERWFAHHDNRNRTVHVYDEGEAERVYARLDEFAWDAEALVERLEAALARERATTTTGGE